MKWTRESLKTVGDLTPEVVIELAKVEALRVIAEQLETLVMSQDVWGAGVSEELTKIREVLEPLLCAFEKKESGV